jgi:hypothetical protein
MTTFNKRMVCYDCANHGANREGITPDVSLRFMNDLQTIRGFLVEIFTNSAGLAVG